MTDISERRAAIIGGGVIGGGWAARFVLNGWDVAVYDPDPDAERKIAAVVTRAKRAWPMLLDGRPPAEGALRFAGSAAEAVAGAAWIQESAPERLQLKRRIYREIEAAAPERAIIGSSTSGFKPSDLRAGLARPERLIVAHPFTPVYLLPLVELVAGDAPDPRVVAAAEETMRAIGMRPLTLRREIDGHLADRLLEAVWREALWLIKDGVATTEEVDDAIRYGFGLRWAQMGMFETYRIGGGEAGMRHFLEQFGPALSWPWSRLTDVPEMDAALVELIAQQSDAQARGASIAELEQRRDDNLVAILRALKARDQGAGAVLNQLEAPAATSISPEGLLTVDRVVPIDWTDYNGHMNESRFAQAFSDAADAVMAHIGADAAYVAAGHSFFTVDQRIQFRAEAKAGARIQVWSDIAEAEGKKLRLSHRMIGARDETLATAEQLLIHVDLQTRRAAPPTPALAARLLRRHRAASSELNA